MRVFSDHKDVEDALEGGAIAIGNFDGVHRGHRALFERVLGLCAESGGPSGALTFNPHPVRVLAPHLAPPLLMTPAQKLRALEAVGLRVVVNQAFTHDFARLTPEAFVNDVLLGSLRVAHVVVGEDFSFGHRGAGKTDLLRRLLEARGASLHVVPAVREGNLVCSSTKIREFLLEGRPEAASLLLGAPYTVIGKVVGGDQRGRDLGIRTANLASDNELIPKIGVYAGFAEGDGVPPTMAVTNIGLRPTFDGEGIRIETHLLDFAGDIYSHELRLRFVGRLRDERKFESPDALKAQIQADIAAARALLAGP